MAVAPSASPHDEHRVWRPRGNVLALAAVSFLTDASSEIIAPLLPLFLVGTLGASVQMVGVIEGFRWACLKGASPLEARPLFSSLAVTIALCAFGIWYFRKTEKTFADVI